MQLSAVGGAVQQALQVGWAVARGALRPQGPRNHQDKDYSRDEG